VPVDVDKTDVSKLFPRTESVRNRAFGEPRVWGSGLARNFVARTSAHVDTKILETLVQLL
jgi:hypothetical protein